MIFYEDATPGSSIDGPSLIVDRHELIDFAKTWDPLPIHIDDAAGIAAFGSLTAPGIYILALKMRLIHRMREPLAVIATTGFDELRFLHPVRPNDELTLRIEWLSRRESRSKPDRGIVTARISLLNQDGVAAMTHLDTILLRKHPAP